MIEFTILGVPVPWARATPFPFKDRAGKLRVRMITSESTRNAEEAFRLQSLKYRPRKPLTGPLRLDCFFVLPMPARLDDDRSRLWPHVKPDADNYVKLVMDSLNEIFWHDDGQICAPLPWKIYGHPPRTIVRVRPLGLEEYENLLRSIGGTIAQPQLFGGNNG